MFWISEEEAVHLDDVILQDPDYFKVTELVKTSDLYKSRVHLGHGVGCRNPHMVPYLYGTRMGIDIIDLDQTTTHLIRALNFLAHISYREGVILFVSRGKKNMYIVENAAKEAGEYSQCRYWNGGTLTNAKRIFGVDVRPPDLVVFLNTQNSVLDEHAPVRECAKVLIPTIGIVDSNCDPRLISYPIPGNDDTPESVQYFCNLFRDTILRAKEFRERDMVRTDDEQVEESQL